MSSQTPQFLNALHMMPAGAVPSSSASPNSQNMIPTNFISVPTNTMVIPSVNVCPEVVLGNTDSKTTRERFTRYAFTSYDIAPPIFDDTRMSYMCYGSEICPETKRHHWQGYMEFHTKMSMIGIKREISKAWHVERAIATSFDNIKYCMGDYPGKELKVLGVTFFAFGRPAPGQGSRSDISRVTNQILQGISLDIIATVEAPTWVKFHRGFADLEIRSRGVPPEWTDVNVEYWYGAEGTGKSSAAIATYPNYYKVRSCKWWDGYIRQKCVIFDEFNPNKWDIDFMKEVMDGYKMALEIKGGWTEKRWDTVIIISNRHWDSIYEGDPFIMSFRRRVKTVRCFDKIPQAYVSEEERKALLETEWM